MNIKKRLLTCWIGILLGVACVFPAHGKCLLDLPLNEGPEGKIMDRSEFNRPLAQKGTEWVQSDDGGFLLKFNGIGHSIRVNSFTNILAKNLTLLFWINPSESDGEAAGIICGPNAEGSGWKGGYSVFGSYKAGVMEIDFNARFSPETRIFKLGNIPLNKFSFIAVTYDNKHVRLYRNGEKVASEEETRDIFYSPQPSLMEIGSTWSHAFNGILRGIKLYDEALDESKIAGLYKEQAETMKFSEKKGSQESYYATDNLFAPRYNLCRNLIQNPSFEAGGRYWTGGNMEYYFDKYFEIDSSESFSGNKSFMFYSYKGYREITRLTSFAIPVKPGEKYTLSFYCRGDKATSLEAIIYTGVWPVFPAKKSFPVTTNWTRHSLTFTAPNAVAAPTFYAQGFPAEDGRVWIDAIQLEAGEKPTDFTEKPVIAELVTDHYNNLCQPGETVNGRLEIYTAKPGITGEVNLTTSDYSGKKLNARKCPFKTNDKGMTAIKLNELDGLACGLYGIKVEFELDDRYSDYDFFRFGVMRYLDNKHKLKDFFSSGTGIFPSPSKSFEKYKHIGLGSCKLINFPSAEIVNLFQKNNISLMPYLAYKGKASYALDGEDGYKNPDIPWDEVRSKYPVYMVGEEQHETIAEVARRIAKAHPEYDNWSLAGEAILPGQKDRARRLGKYMELQRKVAENVRDENPEALVRSPSTCDLYPGNGIAQIEEMWQNGAGDIFDICEAHSYRPRPEIPDLDNDISVLLKMLDKYNFKGKVWFAEDLNYAFYNIPKYGLDTTKFADFWRGMPLSYDIGMGERLQAAYNARMWIIALKYYPRVERLLWHNYGTAMLDINGCSSLACWAPNILGHIFGEGCEYLNDMVFSDDVRCYLFKDSKNRPVAAMWNINEEVDREKREPFSMTFPFDEDEAEVINFVNNKLDVKKGSQLPVPSQPIFVRGKAGAYDEFKEKLGGIKIKGSPVQTVSIQVKPVDMTMVEVKVVNRISKTIKGSFAVTAFDKKIVDENITLLPKEGKTFKVQLQATKDALTEVPLKIEFKAEGSEAPQQIDRSFVFIPCERLKSKITVDGDLSDWDATQGISMAGRQEGFGAPAKLLAKYPEIPEWKGEKDFSAKFYTAWDEEYFYLAVEVQDDVLAPPPPSDSYFWNYDSLQIYFDTFGDARNKNLKDYDNNDYNYNVYLAGEALRVSRNPVPEWQLCFLEKGDAPKVRSAFKKTADGYVYELAFPASELAPLQLKANTALGFAILLWDNDNDYAKRYIALTPKGTTPYQKPYFWPVMLLKK